MKGGVEKKEGRQHVFIINDNDHQCGLLWRVKKDSIPQAMKVPLTEQRAQKVKLMHFFKVLARTRKECILCIDKMAKLYHTKRESGPIVAPTSYHKRVQKLEEEHKKRPYYEPPENIEFIYDYKIFLDDTKDGFDSIDKPKDNDEEESDFVTIWDALNVIPPTSPSPSPPPAVPLPPPNQLKFNTLYCEDKQISDHESDAEKADDESSETGWNTKRQLH